MKFNLRIENLELRSCNEKLLSYGKHTTAEIVEWGKNTKERTPNWTLAYWNKTEEGYNLQFVGKRPFAISSIVFMQLAKEGQERLDSDDIFNHAI